jgi:positive regulator of sigma E activity
MKQNTISHPGIITEIVNNIVKITILSQSTCSSCHAKGVCSISEMKEKVVEVEVSDLLNYKVGQHVNVLMSAGNGGLAVFLGYGMPFVVLIATLIIMIGVTHNEALSGVTSLVATGSYFLLLSLFRKNLKEKFEFSIE